MTIEARIEKDSVGPNGVRLTTFVLKYPRFIHCFDEQTEVLCEIDGFKKFLPWKTALECKPKIANYHKNGKITFEYPINWIVNKIENEELVEIKSQRISAVVTKGHRLWVGSRKSKGDCWEIIKAEDLLSEHTQKRFKTFGYYTGTETLGKLSNLIGFFIGDGTLVKKGNQAIFHLKKERKIKYLTTILKDLKISYELRPYSDGTTNIILRDYLDLFKSCYADDGQKTIPKIIHNATLDSFIGFLDGLWNSDGSTDKGYLTVFNTSSEYVANTICTLASIHGMRINFKSSYDRKSDKHKKMFKLTNCTETSPIIRKDKHPAKIIKYTGNVYCATVSTGLLVVRRNGLVHISGNCEFMTHRVFSRNASSSRAIPFEKQVEEIRKDPAMPLEFRKNQKGMKAGELCDNQETCKEIWLSAMDKAINEATSLHKQGAHKQYVNRILEPFSHICVVVSATEYANFFALRYHSAAQPEIAELARQMYECYKRSEPRRLEEGEWHLPFINSETYWETHKYAKELAKETGTLPLPVKEQDVETLIIKRSVARCARVSYNKHDGTKATIEEDLALYERLLGEQPIHASPAEHQAQVQKYDFISPFPKLQITWSGNFKGWRQYRKTLEGENITTFEGPLG